MNITARPVIGSVLLLAGLTACSDGNSEPDSLARESSPLRAVAPIRVCISGCDYRELQPALDAAPSGAVVRVHQGRYAGGLVIQRAVTLRGDGRNDTVVAGGVPVLTTTCAAPVDVVIEGMGLVDGGGVVNQGCRLTLRDANVSGHTVRGRRERELRRAHDQGQRLP